MNSAISRLLSRCNDVRDLHAQVRIRSRLRANGVLVHRRASLLASDGLNFGKGTVIYAEAIVAATDLGFSDTVRMAPHGAVRLGERCLVMSGAIIASYGGEVSIGDDVSINPGAILYGHGGLTIGDKTRIAAQTIIIPANHVFADPARPIMEQGLNCQGICIGRDVWIGAGARILDGVRIGDGAVVGAGAVVTSDIDDGAVVAGVPARPLRWRESDVARRDHARSQQLHHST